MQSGHFYFVDSIVALVSIGINYVNCFQSTCLKFSLNFSGSEGWVPQRYWHHLWVCWRWHVKLVLEFFGSSWTTHYYWHDFSGFSFFLSCHVFCPLQHSWKFHCDYNNPKNYPLLSTLFLLRVSINSFNDS